MTQHERNKKSDTTRDALFGGRLLLSQPSNGYRFASDSPLLAAFACEGKRARRCVDLGAGCGVVGLSILAAGGAERVVGIEYQGRLADLCLANAADNGLSNSYDLVRGDMRLDHPLLPNGTFDLVVCNPPYRPLGEGRPSADKERRDACHEHLVTLRGWTDRAARLLRPGKGRLCAVFPARRVDSLLHALLDHGMGVTELRAVFPRAGRPAQLVLVEARHGAGGHVDSLSSITLEREDGSWTPEAASVFEGDFSDTLKAREDQRPR